MQPSVLKPPQRKNLKKMGVQAIYLFGSRVLGQEGVFSDYDYAILMKDKGFSKGDATYFELYDLLCEISPRTLKNDVLDIVSLKDTYLELRFHVVQYGKILYDKDPKARLNFEIQTTLLYCDYKPLLKEQDEVILQSL